MDRCIIVTACRQFQSSELHLPINRQTNRYTPKSFARRNGDSLLFQDRRRVLFFTAPPRRYSLAQNQSPAHNRRQPMSTTFLGHMPSFSQLAPRRTSGQSAPGQKWLLKSFPSYATLHRPTFDPRVSTLTIPLFGTPIPSRPPSTKPRPVQGRATPSACGATN
jgi:hypothetical protein